MTSLWDRIFTKTRGPSTSWNPTPYQRLLCQDGVLKRNGSGVNISSCKCPIPAYSDSGQPSGCCSNDAPHTDDVACFSSPPLSTTKINRCADPTLVTTQEDRTRCSSSSACAENSTCVIYASSTPLLRIEISGGEKSRIVLWSGPPLEVWEQGDSFLRHMRASTHCHCS
jgi:hypothetical protein